MPASLLRLPAQTPPVDSPDSATPSRRSDCNRLLLDRLRRERLIRASALAAARNAWRRHGTPVERSLLAQGDVGERPLLNAYAAALGCGLAPLPLQADARAVDRLGAEACLGRGLVPLGRRGGAMVLATARPAETAADLPWLRAAFGRVRFVLAPEADVLAAVLAVRQPALRDRAEARVTRAESCRGWPERGVLFAGSVVAALLILAAMAAPVLLLLGAALLAMANLAAITVLKLAASFAALRRTAAVPLLPAQAPRPTISLLVPLFRETAIATHLLARLGRLRYAPADLEVLLVVEEDDLCTRSVLAQTPMPPQMRIVTVPRGSIKTKPRALNYALPFCRGEIVGVYDAEDAPDPDQLEVVAATFAAVPPEVACLQGALDFYNPAQNLIARCFTIEYATWFRLILPGIARLGLVVPLGGTTLFFRRAALEALDGWDAHNVTEDADLGLRLARHGYRTMLIPTVTQEEANCHPWRWVRQRSRWLKGYAMTWAAHMRRPRRLWRDLGTVRFVGVQVLFLGSVLHYLLAPVLWSFWLGVAGLPHPLLPLLPMPLLLAGGVLFVTAEVASLMLALVALRLAGHRRLMPVVPLMHLYFPLGTIAAWKGLIEIAWRPYYWDKTAHGLAPEAAQSPARRAASRRSRVS